MRTFEPRDRQTTTVDRDAVAHDGVFEREAGRDLQTPRLGALDKSDHLPGFLNDARKHKPRLSFSGCRVLFELYPEHGGFAPAAHEHHELGTSRVALDRR